MATTINSYSVSLAMDAKGFIDGSKVSRSEARQLSKDIDAARNPLESYAVEHDKLGKALASGAIKQGVYNRLLDEQRSKLASAAGVTQHIGVIDTYSRRIDELRSLHARGAISTDDYHRAAGSARWDAWSGGIHQYRFALGGAAIAIGAVTAATALTVGAGVAFVSHMKETQDQIDAVADSAGKLGVRYNELSGLRFAAQEAGGVDAGTVDASIKKMQVGIANAVNDPGSAVAIAFQKLGLNAGDLMKAGPVEAIKQMADGMQGVTSHADKLQIAMAIFGKSGHEMVSTLMGGRDAIAEAVNEQNKWNGLTDAQVVAVQASNDAWDRVGQRFEGISSKMAAEFAPAFLVVADELLGMSDSVTGLDDAMQLVVNTTAYYIGQLKDIGEIFISFPKALMGMNISEALDVSSGQKAMEAVIAKRAELEKQAEAKEAERKLAREKLLAEDMADRQGESKRQAADKLESDQLEAESNRNYEEYKRKRDFQKRLASESLKAAEDHFKRERDNAMKLRDEIAKGPQSLEIGSAESAKFLADQANQALAAKVSPDQGKPTDEQLLIEAQKQAIATAEHGVKLGEQVVLLQKLLDKEPLIGRAR